MLLTILVRQGVIDKTYRELFKRDHRLPWTANDAFIVHKLPFQSKPSRHHRSIKRRDSVLSIFRWYRQNQNLVNRATRECALEMLRKETSPLDIREPRTMISTLDQSRAIGRLERDCHVPINNP